jgi:uncharacterized membrane protein
MRTRDARAAAGAFRRLAARSSLDPTGLLVAGVFTALSLTPSLLPRTWQIQGLISGLSASVGYLVGVAVAAAARWLFRSRDWPPGPRSMAQAVARYLLPVAVGGLVVFFLARGSHWQRELYLLMGQSPPQRFTYVRLLVVTGAILVATIAVARGIRVLARGFGRLLRRRLPPRPADAGGALTVLTLVVALTAGLIQGGVLPAIAAASSGLNAKIPATASAPTSPARSGGPGSLVTWASLGLQGRSFVSGGPTVEQLRRFGGPSAREPVRVYVGLESAPSIPAAAALAVRELERAGGFDRSVLVVVTATGTGWVDPYLAAALEYMHNGDTAMVTIQYSYLPSWVLLLTDRQRAERAGRELFDRVHRKWSTLAREHRPRLLVFGESLGSLGSEAAFADLDDVRARTDGALWAGPTGANRLWSQLVAHRDAGSPEVLPIYEDGRAVRFASTPADLWRPPGPWTGPRVVYLQNPSDPVTWWSPTLALRRPDWLAEPRGYDVLPAMRWYPILTFLQVTADLALAERAPRRHGHNFDRAAVEAWAAIAPPAGWTAQRSAMLSRLLDQSVDPRS